MTTNKPQAKTEGWREEFDELGLVFFQGETKAIAEANREDIKDFIQSLFDHQEKRHGEEIERLRMEEIKNNLTFKSVYSPFHDGYNLCVEKLMTQFEKN